MAIVNKAGHGGSVQISTDAGSTYHNVAFIRNWSVEETSDVVETTTMADSQVRGYKASLKTWTGTADLFIPFNDADDDAEVIAEGNGTNGTISAGTEYHWKFYPDDSDAAHENYTAKGIVTSVSRSVAVDGMAEMSVSIQGTEALS